VGDIYPASDLSDFRSGYTSDDWSVENNVILTNFQPPVAVRFIQDITDCTQWDPCFADAMSGRLARDCCYRVTQSVQLVQVGNAAYKMAIQEAIRSNALESVPAFGADDTWVMARFS
jgi:hypothetical protein